MKVWRDPDPLLFTTKFLKKSQPHSTTLLSHSIPLFLRALQSGSWLHPSTYTAFSKMTQLLSCQMTQSPSFLNSAAFNAADHPIPSRYFLFSELSWHWSLLVPSLICVLSPVHGYMAGLCSGTCLCSWGDFIRACKFNDHLYAADFSWTPPAPNIIKCILDVSNRISWRHLKFLIFHSHPPTFLFLLRTSESSTLPPSLTSLESIKCWLESSASIICFHICLLFFTQRATNIVQPSCHLSSGLLITTAS